MKRCKTHKWIQQGHSFIDGDDHNCHCVTHYMVCEKCGILKSEYVIDVAIKSLFGEIEKMIAMVKGRVANRVNRNRACPTF